jgi:hypothetical protein
VTDERIITVAAARKKVRDKPGHYRAAVIEGTPALRDVPMNDCTLFRLKKTADEHFRTRVKAYDEVSKRHWGGIGHGVVLYADGHAIGLDAGVDLAK